MWTIALKIVLSLFGIFTSPEARKDRKKRALNDRLRTLEEKLARAWAEGLFQKASRISKELDKLREEIRYREGEGEDEGS